MKYTGPERRRNEQDIAYKIGHRLLQKAPVLGGALMLLYIALAVVTFGVIESNRRGNESAGRLEHLLREQRKSAEFNRKGVDCLLEQLAEHRKKTFLHQKQTAEVAGVSPPQVDPPPPVPEHLRVACDPFLDLPPPGPNGDKVPPPPLPPIEEGER